MGKIYLSYLSSSNTIKIVDKLRENLDLNADFQPNIVNIKNGSIENTLKATVETPQYVTLAKTLALEVAGLTNITEKELLMQSRPTIRIFKPFSHSTSLHCDYWYGHGTSAYTIWIPITVNSPKSNFWICSESKNSHLRANIESRPFSSQSLDYYEGDGEYVNTPSSGVAIFSSHALHASPRNDTDEIRISVDFRIMKFGDDTCTKEAALFQRVKPKVNSYLGDDVVPNVRKLLLLKYIHGGRGPSTKSQQILIDAYARENGLQIIAQESEIERLDYPMLRLYLDGLGKPKGITGIIIATKSLLSKDLISKIEVSDVKVIYALENESV